MGNSGLRVSAAALGAMTFGEEWGWGTAKDEARKVYDAFRDAGGNFINTANLYTNGASESSLGEFRGFVRLRKRKRHNEGVWVIYYRVRDAQSKVAGHRRARQYRSVRIVRKPWRLSISV